MDSINFNLFKMYIIKRISDNKWLYSIVLEGWTDNTLHALKFKRKDSNNRIIEKFRRENPDNSFYLEQF